MLTPDKGAVWSIITKKNQEGIHVNPPSFVRSLRHFCIAENLRPGDENLRHLTVTPRFKKTACIFGNQFGKRNIIFTSFRHFDFVSPLVHIYLWVAR